MPTWQDGMNPSPPPQFVHPVASTPSAYEITVTLSDLVPRIQHRWTAPWYQIFLRIQRIYPVPAMRALLHSAVVLLASITCLIKFVGSNHDHCGPLVDAFAQRYGSVPVSTQGERGDGVDPFVFFLHVPRTAGKTYSTCFLSPAVPPSETCLPGYDRYRLKQSLPNCRYYTSHDDLSLIDQLSDEDRRRVEVVTQLRDPVGRVLSMYEFPIEVAARKVKEPMTTIESQMANMTTVHTYNVWPWKYLVLQAREGILNRLGVVDEGGTRPVWSEHFDPAYNRSFYYSRRLNTSEWEIPEPLNALNPYDNELAIPLREWIELEEVEELVHNGHTLQLLGITNSSFWEEAGALRRCFFRDEVTRERLFELAKEKLQGMSHAGLQQRLGDSVASLAASLGLKMSDKAYKSVQLWAYIFDDVANPLDLEAVVRFSLPDPTGDGEPVPQTMTLFQARFYLYSLQERLRDISAKLKKTEPRLRELLKREDKWLESAELERSNSTYWKLRKAYVDPVIARVHWLAFATKCAVTGRLGELEDFDWYDDQAGDALLNASPFASNITSLDEIVARQQRERDRTVVEIEILKGVEGVQGVPWSENTRVFLPFSDEHKLRNDRTLGQEYSKCSEDAYRKGKRARTKPMIHLRNERDEGFRFASEAREQYLSDNAHVVERIRELNSVDERLLEFATQLFVQTIERQAAAGVLEKIPELPTKGEEPENTGDNHGDASDPDTSIGDDHAEL